eukprot:35827_1
MFASNAGNIAFICDHVQCPQPVIYGDNVYNSFDVKCSGSCRDGEFIAENAGNFAFLCDAAECSHIDIKAQNAYIVSINCIGGTYTEYDLHDNNTDINGWIGCSYLTVWATYVKLSVDIKCSGYEGCLFNTIYATNATSLSIFAKDSGEEMGFYYGESIKRSFNVTCIGNYTIACSDTSLYLPSSLTDLANIFKLNCYGYGCAYIQFNAKNGFSSLTASNFEFNGCFQCDLNTNVHNCVGTWYFSYGEQYFTSVEFGQWTRYSTCSGEWVSSDDCGCKIVQSSISAAFTNDVTETNCAMPSIRYIHCDSSVDCIINCTKQECNNIIIDASEATSLFLLCNTENACRNTIIYTPNILESTANISCTASSACNNTYVIYSGDATVDPLNHHINVKCSTIGESCAYLTLLATKAGNVDFSCDVQCAMTTLHVERAETVTVTCAGHQKTGSKEGGGCVSLELYASYVNLVDIVCVGTNLGCAQSKFFVENVRSLSIVGIGYSMLEIEVHGNAVTESYVITCSGSYGEGCLDSIFYLPSVNLENILKLNCYGKGCDRINLYSKNGFAVIAESNLYLNGCNSCHTDTIFTCIHQMYLSCVERDGISVDITVSSCNAEHDLCGCFDVASMISRVFINYAYHEKYCAEQYVDAYRSDDFDFGKLLAIFPSVIIIMCLVYCIRKYRNVLVVNKALVLIIGISEFENKSLNLPGIRKCVENLKQLWRATYKYEVYICNEDSLYCTKYDVINFIDKYKTKLEDTTINCVVVHVLSHGSSNHELLTSELKEISTNFIQHELIEQSVFSNNSTLIKLIFNHACRGKENYFDGSAVRISNKENEQNIHDHDVCHDSNCVTVYGTIRGRTMSDEGFFTKFICQIFGNNATKCIKKYFNSLIIEIGKKLEQKTD